MVSMISSRSRSSGPRGDEVDDVFALDTLLVLELIYLFCFTDGNLEAGGDVDVDCEEEEDKDDYEEEDEHEDKDVDVALVDGLFLGF